jgi:hypothetical protein
VTSLAEARRIALALPQTTEEPHHEKTSFRVRGKIFATAPPDGKFLHALLEEPAVEAWTAEDPAAFAPLRWGQRIRGVRVTLAAAPRDQVAELLEEAWRRRAPRRLAAELDAARAAR